MMVRLASRFSLGVFLVCTGCGSSSQVATVEFSELIEPESPLDAGHMQIAVMNANVSGSTDEFDQDKWSTMTADMIQHFLEQSRESYNIPLKLVDREHLKLTMGEKDLAAAGITDSGDSLASAAVKGADTILTSKVTVKIDKQVGKQRTIDAMSVFGSAWGGGGGIDTTEVDEERRNITVTCQFQLKDAATNDIIASYNGMPEQDTQETSSGFFFGSSQTEADMTPRDQVIGSIIERQAKQFMSKFVPVRIEERIEVEASGHEASEAGVRALVIEDFELALDHFKQAIAEDPEDEESLFGAGVACEKLKRFDDARKYYKLAQSLEAENPNYRQAVRRVSQAG
jgi:hypothetical protein